MFVGMSDSLKIENKVDSGAFDDSGTIDGGSWTILSCFWAIWADYNICYRFFAIISNSDILCEPDIYRLDMPALVAIDGALAVARPVCSNSTPETEVPLFDMICLACAAFYDVSAKCML